MTLQREHDDFVHRLHSLREDPLFKRNLKKGMLNLKAIDEKDIDAICRRADDAGFYFLMAAARLSRTKLKQAQQEPRSLSDLDTPAAADPHRPFLAILSLT